MPYAVEYTDTFGREANYSWVRRASIPEPSLREGATAAQRRRAIMVSAKREVGLTGVRGVVTVYSSDDMEFRPHRSCTVMFVRWKD